MDDNDLRDIVRDAGDRPTDAFRDVCRAAVAGALRGEMELGRDITTPAVSSQRRGLWAGLGLVAAAAVVLSVVTFVVDDDTASVVPATEVPVTEMPTVTSMPVMPEPGASTSTDTAATATSTEPSGAVSDTTMLAALAGHRWVLDSASDGTYFLGVGLVPWIEFGDDPFVRGNDGCNLFGAAGSIDAGGHLTLEQVDSTAMGCSEEVPMVDLTSADRVVIDAAAGTIELRDGTAGSGRSWRLRRIDSLAAPTEDDLVGRWAVAMTAPGFLEFRPDRTAWLGECRADWAVDGELTTSGLVSAATCLDGVAIDATHAALLDILAAGTADVAFDPTPIAARGLLLSTRDRVVRLAGAGTVTGEVLEVSPTTPLPSLAIDAAFDVELPLEFRESTAARGWAPRLQFADDGSLVVLDLVTSTVTAYEPDGMVRWSSSVPAEFDGAHPWDVAVGPDAMLYLSYERSSVDSTAYLLVAVPTAGPRAGKVVASWPTDWQCVETSCAEVRLTEQGVLLAEEGSLPGPVLARYVDDSGGPSGATFVEPGVADQTLDLGPVLPAGIVSGDGLGNILGSFRTTVSLDDRSWTFDVVGAPIVEGRYAAFDAQPDGRVVSTFGVTNIAGQRGIEVWLDLLPDGTVQARRLPDDLGVVVSIALIGGERYGAVVSADGTRYRLVGLIDG